MVGVKTNNGGTEIACNSVLKAINASHPNGKKSSNVKNQATNVRNASMGVIVDLGAEVMMYYLSRFLPTMRIKNIAAMLANKTANNAPAEATPASKLSKACLKIKKATLVLASPGPPPVVV
jgi:hypothetical protein